MTPKKNTPSCLSRFGALGLAAATVVTGLTLSPTAPALAQPSSTSAAEAPQEAPADLVTELPRVSVTTSTTYTDAAGEDVYRFEGTGVPGATIRDAQNLTGWRLTDTRVGDDGRFVHETTNVTPTDENPAWLSQTLNGQNSADVKLYAADFTVALPVVTDVVGSTEFDSRGNTIHRYEGKGVVGATIQFKRPTGGWGSGGTVAADGTFSFVTGWLSTEDGYITIRQTLGEQTSAGVGAPMPSDNVSLPFAMTSPSTGDTFTPGTVVFEGTGTAGSTIALTPQRGLSAVTAVVDKTGHWTARKPLGNGTYVFDITQTSPTGQAQGVINAFVYAPTGSDVERNFEMITPRVGDSFTPDSFVHFVGQGTPGATITLKPQAGLSEATATVDANGFWKIRRGMGNGTYIFSVTQTIGGVVTGKPIVGFVYGPTVDGDPITREFAVTSHASGDTFPANTTVAITGTGTPNATVTLKPQGNLSERTVPVSRDGYWVAPRAMGNGAYTFTITQMLEGNVVGTPITDFVLTPAQ